jgi:hypothetical protein
LFFLEIKPYAGVSTAILLFTKTNSGGTDQVWFYDAEADGMSLDDRRTPLLSEDKLGAMPKAALTADEYAKNNLPDILARWRKREGSDPKRPRTAQSFCVPKADLVAQGYDLDEFDRLPTGEMKRRIRKWSMALGPNLRARHSTKSLSVYVKAQGPLRLTVGWNASISVMHSTQQRCDQRTDYCEFPSIKSVETAVK